MNFVSVSVVTLHMAAVHDLAGNYSSVDYTVSVDCKYVAYTVQCC